MPFAVFITGACVLIIEVVAIRVLSPYYGNTIFTVSSVISVILAALSMGYYAKIAAVRVPCFSIQTIRQTWFMATRNIILYYSFFFDGEEGEENQRGDFTNWKPFGSTYFAEHLNEIYGNNKPIS